MKKIILLSLILGLIGCKEPNTEMDKTLFNTSYDKCVDYLTSSLKSPSSLKIREVNISTVIPDAQDIKKVFGELIANKGVIKDPVKEDKARFRELMVDIEYEAHNSYAASIRGNYQCGYIFRLNKDEKSPESLNTYLYKLISDGENVDLGAHIPIPKFTGSNLYLNSVIKSVVGAKDSQFNEIDTDNYKKVEAIYSKEIQQAESVRALKKQYQDDMEAAEKASAKAETASKAIRKATNYADYDAAVEAADKALDEANAALAKSKISLAAYLKASSASPQSEDNPRLNDAAITSSGFPRD